MYLFIYTFIFDSIIELKLLTDIVHLVNNNRNQNILLIFESSSKPHRQTRARTMVSTALLHLSNFHTESAMFILMDDVEH